MPHRLERRRCDPDRHGLTADLQVATAKKSQELTVSATTGPGSATDEIQVLGKDRLKPKLAKSVTQGGKVIGQAQEASAPRRR